MRIVVYDIEVFAYDWVVCLYDFGANHWTVYHNDSAGVAAYFRSKDTIFCGYNIKHYDNHIVKAIACGADNAMVKEINDFIIVGERQGWDHYFLKRTRFWFDSFDLMDDTQVGTSLKHIEAHLGVPIEETEVDFNISRPLTQEELEQTIRYCKYDVWNTARLLTLRKNYLDCKIDLGRRCGLSAAKALYMTNARLTAAYLGATRVERYDGRLYRYPPNLRREIIPDRILKFFEQIWDMSIPDSELFSRKLEINLWGCPCTYAWGGVHGSLSKYYEEATETRVIQNRDVSSLYPSLLILYHYISRNCADPNKYERTYHERLAAKHMKDKQTASTLKNPLNVTSGAMDQPTNDLYDPLNARSMRISGQLFLTELIIELLTECHTLKLLNFNTDGLMYSVDKSELDKVDAICAEWEKRTRFELETDNIAKVYIKDVNNLLFVDTDGHVKTVGGYLNHGISEKGAWKISNDFTIVKDAVIAYFAYGTPVEETINNCDDIFQFQIIAKAGGGYKSVYRVPADFEQRKKKWKKDNRIYWFETPTGNGYDPENCKPVRCWKEPRFYWENYDGPRDEVQRVNRVYASKTKDATTLVKVKPDGTVGKIANLPELLVIDNKNTLTIEDIDKAWYISKAYQYITDYTGVAVSGH